MILEGSIVIGTWFPVYMDFFFTELKIMKSMNNL